MMLIIAGCSARDMPLKTERPVRVALLSDRTGEPDDRVFHQALEALNRMQPDLIITLGDLIDDAKDGHEWNRVMNMMATLDAPVVYTAGNHDIVDAESEARFEQYTGHNSYRSFDVEGWHFVIVDNAIGESWEELDLEQREWLEEDLFRAHREGRQVLVFMHKPYWMFGIAAGNDDPMHQLFVETGVRAVLAGHWHQHFSGEFDDVRYYNFGPSGGGTKGLLSEALGNVPEIGWLTLAAKDISVTALQLDGIRSGSALNHRDYGSIENFDRRSLRGTRLVLASTGGEAGELVIAIENSFEQPIDSTLSVEPRGWSLSGETTFASLRIEPGSRYHAKSSVRRTPGSVFPIPRLGLDLPSVSGVQLHFEFLPYLQREATLPLGTPPSVDGKIEDDEWSDALLLSEFGNSQGLPAQTDPTEVYLKHDAQAIYFAARCHDSSGKVKAIHGGRDGQVVYDDRIGMIIGPSDRRVAWFYVTPRGAVWDWLIDFDTRKFDSDWNGIEASASRDAGGWTAEVRLPFEALGVDAVPPWFRFNIRRKQESTQREALWTPAFDWKLLAEQSKLFVER